MADEHPEHPEPTDPAEPVGPPEPVAPRRMSSVPFASANRMGVDLTADAADEPLAPYVSLSADPDLDEGPVADTPMLLSHHFPEDYDRCAVIAGKHVCRRCLVLYPLALVSGVAISIGSWWPAELNPWVLWLFPLPGVIEFVLDNLGLIEYSPWRQMVLSAGGAVAAGVGYSMYIQNTFDGTVWAVVGVYTAVCVAAVVVGHLRKGSAA